MSSAADIGAGGAEYIWAAGSEGIEMVRTAMVMICCLLDADEHSNYFWMALTEIVHTAWVMMFRFTLMNTPVTMGQQ